jgi:hypothetical protein
MCINLFTTILGHNMPKGKLWLSIYLGIWQDLNRQLALASRFSLTRLGRKKATFPPFQFSSRTRHTVLPRNKRSPGEHSSGTAINRLDLSRDSRKNSFTPGLFPLAD